MIILHILSSPPSLDSSPVIPNSLLMSGHSKWRNIKRTKEVTDAKKAKVFGKIAKDIASAVRQGGVDPAANAALRDAIARAREVNMPQVNIDRLLHSKLQAAEQVMYEAFGPGGSGLLIVTQTDNPNRTVGQLRTLLQEHGGSLAGPHSVRWKFSEAFVALYPLHLPTPTAAALTALVNRLKAHDDVIRVYTDGYDNSRA